MLAGALVQLRGAACAWACSAGAAFEDDLEQPFVGEPVEVEGCGRARKFQGRGRFVSGHRASVAYDAVVQPAPRTPPYRWLTTQWRSHCGEADTSTTMNKGARANSAPAWAIGCEPHFESARVPEKFRQHGCLTVLDVAGCGRQRHSRRLDEGA